VVTTEGLAVTLPRGGIFRPGKFVQALTSGQYPQDAILWLGRGDALVYSGEGHLVFVAPGGQIGTPRQGATFFVQRDRALWVYRGGRMVQSGMPGVPGGGTQSLARTDGVHVFYEPGAILPEDLKKAPLGRETPAIVPSFFDRPFVILPGPLFRP